MKKQTSIHVPTPCHEDWHKMTPTKEGRYCESCAKNVIDFSMMTDQQILNHLAKSTGRLCGRFSSEQLQRPLTENTPAKKKTWWIALFMPLLLWFEKTDAQKKKAIVGTTGIVMCEQTATKKNSNKIERLIGETIVSKHQEKVVTIKGRLVGDREEPLAYATISIKDHDETFYTNTTGKFEANLNGIKGDQLKLEFNYIGYEKKEVVIDVHKDGVFNMPDVSLKAAYMGGIVVTGYAVCKKPMKKIDTVTNTVRKIFKTEIFSAFPNPVNTGEEIHIDLKKEGSYSIQLLDEKSTPVAASYFDAIKGSTVTKLSIPSHVAKGIYFIRIIDNKKKKQYVDKILIQ